jgi:hypothetical protein
MGVAVTTLNRNVIYLSVDWRHLQNIERVLRASFDYCERNGGAIIPVELVNFDARARGNKVDLNWQTASEYQSDRFEIERASFNDAGKGIFSSIATVKAAGTSTEVKNYNTEDGNVQLGKKYAYRLKMIDLDGKFMYSDEKVVELTGNDVLWLGMPKPNPSSSKVSFEFSTGNQNVDVVVYDLDGKVVTPKYQINSNEIEFDLNGLSSGSYTIIIKSGDLMQKKQFQVVK